jgi:hypothetical protein
VLGEVATELPGPARVVQPLQHQRRRGDQRQEAADVDRQQLRQESRRGGGAGAAVPGGPPPLLEGAVLRQARRQQHEQEVGLPGCLRCHAHRLGDALADEFGGIAEGVVLSPERPGERVDEHERLDPLGVGGCQGERRRSVAERGDDAGALDAQGVEDSDRVLRERVPARDVPGVDRVRQPDAAAVEARDLTKGLEPLDEARQVRLCPLVGDPDVAAGHQQDGAVTCAAGLVGDMRLAAAGEPGLSHRLILP